MLQPSHDPTLQTGLIVPLQIHISLYFLLLQQNAFSSLWKSISPSLSSELTHIESEY